MLVIKKEFIKKLEPFRSLASYARLQLSDLVLELACSVHELLLIDGRQGGKNDQLEHEVGDGAQNYEVVQTSLYFAHLGGPPMGHPVRQPEQVSNECNREQEHQLGLFVLSTDEKVKKEV